MKTYSVFRLDSGEFLGREITSGDEETIRAFAPPGCGLREGSYDPLRQRVDVPTGNVVEWESPRLAVEAREREVAQALRRIADLESRQARAVREALVNPNSESRERLAQLDADIAAQRRIINGNVA